MFKIVCAFCVISMGMSAMAAQTQSTPSKPDIKIAEQVLTAPLPSDRCDLQKAGTWDISGDTESMKSSSVNDVKLPKITRLFDGQHHPNESSLDLGTGGVGIFNKNDFYAMGPIEGRFFIFTRSSRPATYDDHDGALGGAAPTADKILDLQAAPARALQNGGIQCPPDQYYTPFQYDVGENVNNLLCVRARDGVTVALINIKQVCAGDKNGGLVISWTGDADKNRYFAPSPQQQEQKNQETTPANNRAQ